MCMDRIEKIDGLIVLVIGCGGFWVDDGYYVVLLLMLKCVDGWILLLFEDFDEVVIVLVLGFDLVFEFILFGIGVSLCYFFFVFCKVMEVCSLGIEVMDSCVVVCVWSVLWGEGCWIVVVFYLFEG